MNWHTHPKDSLQNWQQASSEVESSTRNYKSTEISTSTDDSAKNLTQNFFDKLKFSSKLSKITQQSTTPKQDLGDEKYFYSFFSGTDVSSLIASEFFSIGLITDRVWILVKGYKFAQKKLDSQGEMELYNITLKKAQNRDVPIKEIAKNFLKKNNLLLFTAKFNEALEQVN
jgi:hypothetical protein